MNKQYLINAMSQLSPEQARAILIESQKHKLKQKEIPEEKIQDLQRRCQSLTENTQIKFPINIAGTLTLSLQWDGIESCYVDDASFQPSQTDDDSLGVTMFREFIDEGILDIPSVSDVVEPFNQKGIVLVEEMEELAANYGVGYEDVYEKVIDASSWARGLIFAPRPR